MGPVGASGGRAALKHAGAIRLATFDGDGKTIWTGFPDRMLRRWNAATGKPIGRPVATRHDPNYDGAARIHPSGMFYLAADRRSAYWDAATGEPLPDPFPRLKSYLRRGEFGPDGRLLITLGIVWDVAPGTNPAQLWSHPDGVKGLRWSPDGSVAASVALDGVRWMIRFLRAVNGRVVGEPIDIPIRPADGLGEPGHPSDAVAFSPDGTAAVVAFDRHSARLLDTRTGRPRAHPLEHRKVVCGVAFSPDGTRAPTASADCTARLWDAATGAPIGTPLQHEPELSIAPYKSRMANSITGVAFSPDGRRLLTWAPCAGRASAGADCGTWRRTSRRGRSCFIMARCSTPPSARTDGCS